MKQTQICLVAQYLIWFHIRCFLPGKAISKKITFFQSVGSSPTPLIFLKHIHRHGIPQLPHHLDSLFTLMAEMLKGFQNTNAIVQPLCFFRALATNRMVYCTPRQWGASGSVQLVSPGPCWTGIPNPTKTGWWNIPRTWWREKTLFQSSWAWSSGHISWYP